MYYRHKFRLKIYFYGIIVHFFNRSSNFFSANWVGVTEEAAQEYRYYGFKGWLLFFYILTVLSLIYYISVAAFPNDPHEFKYFGNNEARVRFVNIICAVVSLPYIILAPLKHSWTPAVWLAEFWIVFFVSALAIEAPDEAVRGWVFIALSLTTSLLMTWYIFSSKRVNVTYRHRVLASAIAAENGSAPNPPKPIWRRWTTYLVAIPSSAVVVIFVGLFIIGSYEALKRQFGDAVKAGEAIAGANGAYTVTPPDNNWVRLKPGTISDNGKMEFFGPTIDTWAIIHIYKGRDRTLQDVVNGRLNDIDAETEEFSGSEERSMMHDDFIPVSYAKYTDRKPFIPPATTWWVATIETDDFSIEVVAATSDPEQLPAIEKFVRSVRLTKE